MWPEFVRIGVERLSPWKAGHDPVVVPEFCLRQSPDPTMPVEKLPTQLTDERPKKDGLIH